jgi:hypothetical protein
MGGTKGKKEAREDCERTERGPKPRTEEEEGIWRGWNFTKGPGILKKVRKFPKRRWEFWRGTGISKKMSRGKKVETYLVQPSQVR